MHACTVYQHILIASAIHSTPYIIYAYLNKLCSSPQQYAVLNYILTLTTLYCIQYLSQCTIQLSILLRQRRVERGAEHLCLWFKFPMIEDEITERKLRARTPQRQMQSKQILTVFSMYKNHINPGKCVIKSWIQNNWVCVINTASQPIELS